MLLLLLNDENNAIVGEGIDLIVSRDAAAAAAVQGMQQSDAHAQHADHGQPGQTGMHA
jgi:hypothetical protein